MERYPLLNPSAPLRECVRPLGDATAYNVQVSAHESVHKRGEWAARDQLRTGEATTFMAVRTMGTTDSTITVEWSDEPGDEERESWRYPLPPRPPRRYPSVARIDSE